MEIEQRELEAEFNVLMMRYSHVFASGCGFRMCQNYLRGLMGAVERKNGWQMAEYLGETTPYSIQQFLYRGRFSADALRDVSRQYVIEELGEEEAVLVVDETGFLKQGKKSCGVKRQYSGTAGRMENCQIGVFLTYSSTKGHTPIDRRLYMPEDWITDRERCKAAGVPDTITFKTKLEMALEMIRDATGANVPYTWVTGDCVYGDYTNIRLWLEQNRKCYVMSVSGKAYVWLGFKQNSISSIVKSLPPEGWFEASCGGGSKGERLYDWMTIQINAPLMKGWCRTVLIRRSKTNLNEIRAYICFYPENTPAQKLAEIAGTRWTVETCFKESKGETGLDQYDGWYKHITLACIAITFITVLSCKSFDGKPMQRHDPSGSSLEGFKKRRDLHV